MFEVGSGPNETLQAAATRQETPVAERTQVVMSEHESSRTLVKSTPELWAECSDPAALARHLGSVGEIRITRLEPETTVAWEGTAARGTVELEPAGWGTRVILTMSEIEGATETAGTAVAPATDPQPEVEPVVSSASPEADGRPEIPARPGFLARLRARLRGGRAAVPEPLGEGPEATAQPLEPQPRGETAEAPAEAPSPGLEGESVLQAALDSLGRAHHRPYSRA